MERPSPSHIGGMSPHSSSASLTSFLGGGNPGNSPSSANAIASGIMSMSLVGGLPHGNPVVHHHSPQHHVQQQSPPHHGGGSSNNSSIAIRHEIQRFESVHPSIYAIYDLIELVPDPLLAQQIREHVVCIEDSFVNSQEWTLSRGVPDIRLGIVGSLSSGKSALVHRYLTGSYMQEESPEGGRFKKEVVVDSQSYLLLIRDEGGPPELQFTSWVDAVIFVFSLENEASFNAIYNYYIKMSQFRNMQEIPLILVGTQDAISENQPRVIDDSRARKLANDLKRCAYYETCATYGLNVERVFQDACQKLTQNRNTGSRPATPNHYGPRAPYPSTPGNYTQAISPNGYNNHGPSSPGFHSPGNHYDRSYHKENRPPVHMMTPGTNNSYHHPMYYDDDRFAAKNRAIMVPPPMPPPSVPGYAPVGSNNTGTLSSTGSTGSTNEIHTGNGKFVVPQSVLPPSSNDKDKELPTPSSTPTQSRKNRRRSNLFTPSKKQDESKDVASNGTGQLGSGRSIPVKQGLLYKKSSNSFSKDWKKKYVTLCDDGRLAYHPSLNDYMSNVHGKEIPLQYVTVKVPGQKPRGSRTVPQPGSSASSSEFLTNSASTSKIIAAPSKNEKVLLTGYEVIRDHTDAGDNNNIDEMKNNNEKTTPNVKKRHHRRIKSNGIKTSSTSVYDNGGSADDSGGSCQGSGQGPESNNFEFHIVSLDNKQWHFEAASAEERDEWVAAIEQQILSSLQGIDSNKAKSGQTTSVVDLQAMKTIKNDIPGNDKCVDCDAPNPDWASINLGVLICIQCSGVHRNLGSHISRVRSLDLDEWPPGHLAVMGALGNRQANSVWEARLGAGRKPGPHSSQEEKERFILSKYNKREFLAPLSGCGNASSSAHLVDAICRSDVKAVYLVLTHSSSNDVNAPVSSRDERSPLHIASSLGHLAIAQMLIWANANVKQLDHDGRSCVSHARNSGNPSSGDLVDLLLNNGCPDISLSGTLPRRKNSVGTRKSDVLEKVTSSVL